MKTSSARRSSKTTFFNFIKLFIMKKVFLFVVLLFGSFAAFGDCIDHAFASTSDCDIQTEGCLSRWQAAYNSCVETDC